MSALGVYHLVIAIVFNHLVIFISHMREHVKQRDLEEREIQRLCRYQYKMVSTSDEAIERFNTMHNAQFVKVEEWTEVFPA